MKLFHIFLIAIFATLPSYSFASEKENLKNTIKLEMVEKSHKKDLVYSVKLTDIKTGKPLTEADLKTAHTQKLHLLVIDPSLTEYHHLHPIFTKEGEWIVDLLTRKAGHFRVWADVTRASTGQQEYIMTDIVTDPSIQDYKIDKSLNLNSTIGEYSFTLEFDSELKAGEAAMAKITVRKNGTPFKQLEPIMGAFAHVVGFNEDYKSIMHIHPLGKEPEKESERGGSVLEFHVEPEKAGFTKLFAQFRIDNKDVFAPFGVMVK